MSGLQVRSGKNAAPKPFGSATVTYGPHRSYLIDQSKGAQLLIPGPPLPGSGSKNLSPRAQDAQGQFDLVSERYMGARARSLMTQSKSLGIMYGVTGNGALTGIAGDLLLMRPNGKALKIGSVPIVGVNSAVAAEYSGLFGTYPCLAPGEDIVFMPNAPAIPTGTGLFVPGFVDTDLICFRQPLTLQKQVVLAPPPGKVWYIPPGCGGAYYTSGPCGGFNSAGILNLDPGVAGDHTFEAFLNAGGADIKFDAGTAPHGQFTTLEFDGVGDDGGIFIPAGHSIKIQLTSGTPVDTFFCAVMAEYNQAQINDEDSALSSIPSPIIVPPTP